MKLVQILTGENETTEQNNETVVGEDNQEGNQETSNNEVTVGDSEENPVDNSVTNEVQENPDDSENVGNEVTVGEDKEPEEPYIEPEATVEVSSENPSIYKGYLYANATSDLYYETNYNTIDTISIVGGKNITSLTVQDEQDKIKFITNTKIALMDDTCYRQTRISVDEFNSIFGKDGNIAIYSPTGELIGNINRDLKPVGGEYVFKYLNMYSTIKLEFTGIRNDGKISIKNDKQIKDNTNYTREQINLFSSINTMTIVNLYKGEEVKTYTAEGDINLEETESKMTINMDTTDLSIEDKNEVAINVTLKTDEERYDLFENPNINIEFPSAIEDVEIEKISLLYKNGLSIDNYNVVTNDLGKKVLNIQLSGNQMEYTPGAVHEGTTLVIYTNLDVNRLTADSKDTLKMTYSNKDTVRLSYALEGKESETFEVGFVGRQELVRSSQITEQDVATATSYDEDTEKIQIPVNKEHNIIVNNSIVNNFETELNDVVIVGRIPFVGNEDGYGNDLGTNFDSVLRELISTSGVMGDIYYSEDGKAEKDSDSWTLDTSDVTKYKSYKIVLKEKKLEIGGRISFNFSLLIPDTVGYNAKGYTNYTVYYKIDNQEYTNGCAVGVSTEEKEVELDDIKDEEKEDLAELTIGTQVSQAGKVLGVDDSVYERQILKYTVVVKNNSDVTAENITVKCGANNGNIYGWNYVTAEDYWGYDTYTSRELKEFTKEEKEFEEFTIESLGPNESKTLEYQVVVHENVADVNGIIKVSGNQIEEKTIETSKLKVDEGKLEIRTGYAGGEDPDELSTITESRLKAYLYIKNISGTPLENVKATLVLPSDLRYEEGYLVEGADNIKYDSKNSVDGTVVTFYLDKLTDYEEKTIYIETMINPIDLDIYSKIISIEANAEVDNEVYKSNIYTKKVIQGDTKVDYTWTCDYDTDMLMDEDELTFTLKIKNTGFVSTKGFTITPKIDRALENDGVEIYKNGNLQEEKDELENSDFITLEPGEEMQLNINCIANVDLLEMDQQIVEAQATVNGTAFESFDTNVISYKIENDNLSGDDDSDDEEEDEDYDYEDYDDEEQTNPSQGDNNDNNNDSQNQPSSDNNQNPSEDQNNNNNNGNSQNNSQNNGQNSSNNENPNGSQNQTPNQAPAQNSDDDDDDDEDSLGYNVSGLAWIDKNQDGIRQEDEELKEGVIVTLYKANENGGLDTKNKIDTTSTGTSGTYLFEDVKNGKYILVFDYNSNKYKVTRFQVENAKTTENSDVISKTLTIDGVSQILGVSDVIEVSNSGVLSIDIGLVDKTNFDLSLEKVISSITVKNDEGTKTYDYNDIKDGKIEIRSKYFKSSVLDINYKFIVKNEGDVSGYVNKIIDYLPENVQVVLNKSEGWYISEDNNLYYTGIANEEIKPNETKEFNLVIRKDLSNGESAKLENGAEIVEVTNNLGLLDRDSIENNKIQNEDDYGKATLLIAVATGHSVEYITTTLMIIIMVSVVIMIVIKIKNTKKVYR